MKWNKLYNYPPCVRSTIKGMRKYEIGKEKLPSVTTILSATQSSEKTAELKNSEVALLMKNRRKSSKTTENSSEKVLVSRKTAEVKTAEVEFLAKKNAEIFCGFRGFPRKIQHCSVSRSARAFPSGDILFKPP